MAEMVLKCAKCRAENLSDSLFCEECSAPLEAACPTCGAGNRPTAKFCRKCRAPLTAAPAAAPDPRAATPKHLADKILQSKSALEGERKQVTVLFADVQGSMELAMACGDAAAADRALRQALDLYRTIGATGHAKRLGRELGT